MGERKSQNKYLPPDFDGAVHGTVNGYHGTHPLRDRARKLESDGVLIVRFELPFSLWCDGCGALVPLGTRYNAEKRRVGRFHSTPIFSFTFKCRECRVAPLVIETDPAAGDFRLVSGGRRKATPDDAVAAGELEPAVVAVTGAGAPAIDPMARLERSGADAARGRAAAPLLVQLESLRRAQFAADYDAGAAARTAMRARKRAAASERAARAAHFCPPSVTLLAPAEDDTATAARVVYAARNPSLLVRERKRKREADARAASIFAHASPLAVATAEAMSKRRRLLAAKPPAREPTSGAAAQRAGVAPAPRIAVTAARVDDAAPQREQGSASTSDCGPGIDSLVPY